MLRLRMFQSPEWYQETSPRCPCRYTAAKRFGLEGCETLIPGMKSMIDRASDLGVETVCIGMPHRGASTRLCMRPF